MIDIAAALIVVAALCAWANERWLHLPTAVGAMGLALALSTLLLLALRSGITEVPEAARDAIASIDFGALLMQGMLSFLLFAGALHVDVGAMRRYRWQIGALAIVGTLSNALLVGFGTHYALGVAGIDLPLSYSLAFGALIAPTDPIAVRGAIRSANAPLETETAVAGESLFNDGVSIVLFTIILQWTHGNVAAVDPVNVAIVALREVVGGLALGFVVGRLLIFLMKRLDNFEVEILMTLAAVMGGYTLADRLGMSGPLATVVIGLLVGERGRRIAMSEQSRREIDGFWSLVDTLLNTLLFVLLGLEAFVLDVSWSAIPVGVVAIAITIAARALVVGLPVAALPRVFRLPPNSWKVMVWAGLRGGISVALALSLPRGDARDIVVLLTYMIVLFSVLAQGLTIGRLTRRWFDQRE